MFSNGILFLAVAAGGLIVAFGGVTNALIPLYAVGVFTSFTLSQLGMVRYQQRHREPGWRRGVAISATGVFVTFGVLLVVAITKFTSGAYVPIIVLPAIVGVFVAIRRHYDRVNAALAVEPADVRPESLNHTIVVLVGRVHRGVLKALAYAESLRPNHIAAVYVAYEDDDTSSIESQWRDFRISTPLEIVHSPYRELVDAVNEYLSELDDRWGDDTITVVIPEFVVGKWYEQALHNQSALALKLSLLFREGTVVTSVPYHVDSGRGPRGVAVDTPARTRDSAERPQWGGRSWGGNRARSTRFVCLLGGGRVRACRWVWEVSWRDGRVALWPLWRRCGTCWPRGRSRLNSRSAPVCEDRHGGPERRHRRG